MFRRDCKDEVRASVPIDEYIRWTDSTAVYPKDREEEYLRLGLLSEVGEVAGVLKRRVRDGVVAPEKLLAEVGDLLWYLARLHRDTSVWSAAAKNVEEGSSGDIETLLEIAVLSGGPVRTVSNFLSFLHAHSFTLEQVIASNTDKLEGRKQRNTIHGAGDER